MGNPFVIGRDGTRAVMASLSPGSWPARRSRGKSRTSRIGGD